MEKVCRICGNPKYLEEFHKKKGTADGHRNECKECVKDIQKKYKEAPGFKEKRQNYDKTRYGDNREDILKRKKEYHLENRDKILTQKEQYRNDPNNVDRIKDYLENYRIVHREDSRSYAKNYRTEFPEKFYKYRNDNPHIITWRSLLYTTLDRLGTAKQGHTIDSKI